MINNSNFCSTNSSCHCLICYVLINGGALQRLGAMGRDRLSPHGVSEPVVDIWGSTSQERKLHMHLTHEASADMLHSEHQTPISYEEPSHHALLPVTAH